jgi:RimJ/RimL family protein N-acetyltransferase
VGAGGRLTALSTSRLILRPWRQSDLAPFAAINADPEVMRFFPAPLSRAESDAFARRIMARHASQGFGFWAVEEKGAAPFIGFIGLNTPTFDAPFMPCVEIAWRLARSHWGMGYATEGARAVLAHAFGTLGLNEVVSFTTPANARSRGVMERLGMAREIAFDFDHPRVPEGHAFRSHVLYRLRASEFTA